MGKQGIFEYINIQNKTNTHQRTGKPYELAVVVSDDANKIKRTDEIGMKLRQLGFLWHANEYFFKLKNQLTQEDINAIKELNDNLVGQGQGAQDAIFEYVQGKKETFTKKDGTPYEVYVISSDNPREIARDTEVGRTLKNLGFYWHAKQRWQKKADMFTPKDLEAVKKINDYLKSEGNQAGEIEEFQDSLEALREKLTGADIPLQTKTELDKSLESFIAKIANATEEQADAIFQHYLSTANKFYNYSDENQTLIFLQRPDATRIASRSDWIKMGRSVDKPEEAITINCGNNWYLDTTKRGNPEREYKIGQKRSDDDYIKKSRLNLVRQDPARDVAIEMRQTKSKPTTFAACPVYDVSATSGRELSANNFGDWTAEVNTNNDNSAVANEVFEVAKKSLEANGIQVTQQPSTGGEAGWSRRGQYNVSQDVTGTYAVSTIIKEWAGDLLHQEGGEFYDDTLKYFEEKGDLSPAHIRQIEQVQESTVAAAICNNMGLPTDEHPAYMAKLRLEGGLDSAQLIRENISSLTKVARYIIKELRRHQRVLNNAAGTGTEQPQDQSR